MSSVNPYSNEKEFPSFQNYNIENYNGHFLDIGNNEISNEKNEELLNSLNNSSNLVNDFEPEPLNAPSLVQTDTIPVSYESTPINVTYIPEPSIANDEDEPSVPDDEGQPSVADEDSNTPEISDKKTSSEDIEVVNISNTETNISNTETNIISEEEESNEINVTNNYFNFFNRHKICPIRMTIIFLLIVIIGILFFLK